MRTRTHTHTHTPPHANTDTRAEMLVECPGRREFAGNDALLAREKMPSPTDECDEQQTVFLYCVFRRSDARIMWRLLSCSACGIEFTIRKAGFAQGAVLWQQRAGCIKQRRRHPQRWTSCAKSCGSHHAQAAHPCHCPRAGPRDLWSSLLRQRVWPALFAHRLASMHLYIGFPCGAAGLGTLARGVASQHTRKVHSEMCCFRFGLEGKHTQHHAPCKSKPHPHDAGCALVVELRGGSPSRNVFCIWICLPGILALQTMQEPRTSTHAGSEISPSTSKTTF